MRTLRQFAARPETVPATTSWYLADLGEARGKQELFTKQSPQRLKVLREHALIESAVSSNRIEGVEVDQARVGTIVFGKALLRDRDEEEVRGYRKALDLIHTKGAGLPVSQESICSLHALSRGSIGDAGQNKDRYYETLKLSSVGWHDGEHNPWHYINFLLYILLDAYKEFGRRVGETAAPRGSKTALVLDTIDRRAGTFQASDLQRDCPGV